MRLDTKITQLHRVGKALSSKLRRLGIETVQDLLFHFPFRYEDFSTVLQINALVEGMQTTVQGRVELIAGKRSPRKKLFITEAVISDGNDQLRVVWFGQPYITKTLKVGDMISLSGKIESDMLGLVMKSPSYEKIKEVQTSAGIHTARIVPLYPLTAGMTQKQIRFLVDQVIDLSAEIDEWIPEHILDTQDLISISGALRGVHAPESAEELGVSLRRLKFDELFVLQLRGEMIRQSLKRSVAPNILFQEKEIQEFVHALPFTLTKDQKVAAWKILQDCEKGEPMNRLLEGDVGSGKTVVAELISYNAVLGKHQVAIMAPTEILAKQHYLSFVEMLGTKVTIGLLTGNICEIDGHEFKNNGKAKKRDEFLELLSEGHIDIAIGTHALLTDDVQFHQLSLVIVDEQHRFGVEQRKKIRGQSGNEETAPHFLSMTATPIPRSFALTLYGDLDLSMIKEMPAGRKPVNTRLIEPKHRAKAYQFIRAEVKKGRQVFVICPLIQEKEDGSEATGSEKKTVMSEYEKLHKDVFPDLRIGYLHGKMKSGEKDEIMQTFADGKIDVLVSTSVVEVGVNIPNASVMMIEGAEHFGLAQLHQFRGRVGRSGHQSYCFLFTQSDSQKVLERLHYFEETNDGFKVAEYDLEMRGPGEVYGKNQSGVMHLKLATLQDAEIIKAAREAARGVDFDKYPSLRERVEAWEAEVHLE